MNERKEIWWRVFFCDQVTRQSIAFEVRAESVERAIDFAREVAEDFLDEPEYESAVVLLP